jgi:hypothetical protein
MKKIVVIVFAGLLVSAGLQAQKVYIEKDGQGNKKRVILDMTKTAGMPAGAITDESKTAIYDNITVSNTSLTVIAEHNNDTHGDINHRVFQKLEIALTDLGEMNWVAAFNGCRASSYNDGGWRLPTQRELVMMWIFKEALDAAFLDPSGTGATLSSAVYRSATEGDALSAWAVDLGNGDTEGSNSKATPSLVRCVREINQL